MSDKDRAALQQQASAEDKAREAGASHTYTRRHELQQRESDDTKTEGIDRISAMVIPLLDATMRIDREIVDHPVTVTSGKTEICMMGATGARVAVLAMGDPFADVHVSVHWKQAVSCRRRMEVLEGGRFGIFECMPETDLVVVVHD